MWQAKRNGGRYCKKIKPSLQCVEVSKLKYIFLKCSLQHVLLSHRKRGKKVKIEFEQGFHKHKMSLLPFLKREDINTF